MPTPPDEGRDPWWDPLGLWQRSGLGAVDPGLWLPGSWKVPQSLFDLLRSRLIGTAVSFGDGQNSVGFTLTSLEASVGQMAAVTGQVDDVSLRADSVTWRSFRFESVFVRLGNYHTRFGVRPVVVAAPIDVCAVITGEALDAVLNRAMPAWRCEITPAGELCLRRSRRPHWGYLQVLPDVDGGALVLRPCAVGRGRRAWRLPRSPVPYRPRLRLPGTVRFTSVELTPGKLVAHLRVDAWTFDVLDLVTWARRPR